MDGERLHAHVRRPAADRSRARRPLRPPAHARRRPLHLHRLVRCRRARADRRCADRGARRARCRRCDRHAADADDPQRRRAGEQARRLHRRLERHRRSCRCVRAARRRRRRQRHLLALDLLAERPDRPGADPARADPPRRELRAGQQARPAGRRARERRPVRHRLGPRPRQRPGLGVTRDRRLPDWAA